MEWKALANAVIHEGFEPGLEVTYIGCERCGNPAMRVLASEQLPLAVAEHSRVTLKIFECPSCGHREMDCIGTYGLPDYLPGTVLPFAGHYLMFWVGLMEMARRRGNPEKQGGAMDQKIPAKDPLAVDEPVAWRGVEGFFGRYKNKEDYPKFSPGILYRINKGPWQVADTMDRVPPGAELHPCHLQRGED